MYKEKNIIKEERGEGKVVFFVIAVATVVYIIYNEFYKCKLEEKTEQLIKKLATNPSSGQRTRESSKEIGEGSKLTKKILGKTKDTFDKKN